MDVNEQKLFVGCHSKILVWNIESWTLEHRLTNHTQVLRAMTSGQQLSKNIRVNPRVALAREVSQQSLQFLLAAAASHDRAQHCRSRGCIANTENNHAGEQAVRAPRGWRGAVRQVHVDSS